MKAQLEKILVILLLIILIISPIQKEISIFKFKKLEGNFKPTEKPSLTLLNWKKGEFQVNFEKYLEENIGFRNFLVRLINQFDYSLFRTTHAEGVIVGKKDQLLEYDYIRAYKGTDYVGEKIIDFKIRKLKFLQEYLKAEKNIDLILVIEPGKTTYYSENIPRKFLQGEAKETNYQMIIKKAQKFKLKYLDFNAYAKELKKQTKYPLYSKYGTHWSIYGMSVVADSLIKYIEFLRKSDLPEIFVDSLILKTTPEQPDYDIANTLNLLCRLPENEILAYPDYRFENNPFKDKPMVLAVADSYYWNIYYANIPKYIFKNQAFWYFNAIVYPESHSKKTWVKNVNLKEEIEKQNVILIMVTERFLHKFGWGFIEDAYAIYGPTSTYDLIHGYKCDILNDYVWFSSEIEKARVHNITLEKDLDENAEYLFSQKDFRRFLRFKGPVCYENTIRNDKNWLKMVQKNAKDKKVSLEEMIRRDALHLIQTNYPEAWNDYLRMNSNIETIKNDSNLFKKAVQLSERYYLTIDEAVQIQAERLFDNKEPL